MPTDRTTRTTTRTDVHDLRHHGDAEATPGLLDLAVNVRGTAPPAWLTGRLVRASSSTGVSELDVESVVAVPDALEVTATPREPAGPGEQPSAPTLTLVPDEWLETSESMPHADDVRAAYVENLLARLAAPQAWSPAFAGEMR